MHVDEKNWDLGVADFDIVIRPTRNPPEGWVGLQVGLVAMAVYGTRLWCERAACGQSLEWLTRAIGTGSVSDHAWISQFVEPASVVARFGTASSLLEAARAGLGVALLPRFVGEKSGLFVIDELKVVKKEFARLWLLCHPALRRDQRVRSLFSVARKIGRL